MNKLHISIIVSVLWIMIYGCTSDTLEDTSKGPFYFNPLKTTISWTAYKYTTRFGVSGNLPDVVFEPKINTIDQLKDIKNIITDFQFESKPNFLEEGATLRNQNIQSYFMDKLGSKKICGKVISVIGSETKGNMSLELTFNGVKKIQEATYSITSHTIELNCNINLTDFNALDALNSLHNQVEDLHKGPDGISVTWPDVAIKVVSILDSIK